jgi:hypothetical protein
VEWPVFDSREGQDYSLHDQVQTHTLTTMQPQIQFSGLETAKLVCQENVEDVMLHDINQQDRKTSKLHGSGSFMTNRQYLSYSRVSQNFMEPEG